MSVKDFDAFFKETEKKPIEFKLFGKNETIPATLPAMVILKLNRAWGKYGNKDLPKHEILDVGISIFGDKKIEEWSKKGLTSSQLEELLSWAMKEYNIRGEEEEGSSGDDSKKKSK